MLANAFASLRHGPATRSSTPTTQIAPPRVAAFRLTAGLYRNFNPLPQRQGVRAPPRDVAATAAMSNTQAIVRGLDAMPRIITDAQIHLWEPETPGRPWPSYGRAYAHGDALPATEVLERMDAAGVQRAVLVPPSWEGDRNDVCLAAARDFPDRFAVMGRLAIEEAASRDALSTWRATPGMLGVRLTFHNDFQRAWLHDGTAEWFWEAAERLAIPVMVFVPGSLSAMAGVAERYPGLRLVIDHLSLIGRLDDGIFTHLPNVLALARYPNVAVKASCMPSLVTEGYPYPTLQRAIADVVRAFGPERTFWGSDLSRLPCPLLENVRLFTEACTFLSSEDLDWIMGRGIAAWLDWPH